MRILVDENIPIMTVRSLRELGHVVIDIRGTHQMGISDEELWSRAQQEKALLVTTDKAFVRQSNSPHHGVLVIRLRNPNRAKIHSRVLQALARFQESDWPNLVVSMRDRVQSVRKTRPTR